MKALAMRIAWSLKASKHYKVCLKCGHMNNGEVEVYKRICRCAVPIFDPEVLRLELESRRHFKGDAEEAWRGKAPRLVTT